MDLDEAREGLAAIQRGQALAVNEAAGWRWPRWYLVATAALMVGVAAALDFHRDYAFFTVVYCAGVSLLQIPLRASMRLRLRGHHLTLRVTWPMAALPFAVAGVYALALVAASAAGTPYPSTMAGLVMAAVYLAGLPVAHRMTTARLTSARPPGTAPGVSA